MIAKAIYEGDFTLSGLKPISVIGRTLVGQRLDEVFLSTGARVICWHAGILFGSMSQTIAIADLDEERLLELPNPCRGCVYWEAPEAFEKGPNEALKKNWIRTTRAQFGNCGKILYLDEQAVGYALYGPSDRFPAIPTYGSIPVGELRNGTVFLACLVILDANSRGKGFGRKLLQEVVLDLRQRGFAAVETLARAEDPNNPSGPRRFYEANGFRTKSVQNPEFPLMRLELLPLPE